LSLSQFGASLWRTIWNGWSTNVSYYSCYYNTIALYSVTFVMSRVRVKRCDKTPALLIYILHAPCCTWLDR
jgi:hypothetical protein